jgi:hypothetical protein
MKILSALLELLHANRCTDRHSGVNRYISFNLSLRMRQKPISGFYRSTFSFLAFDPSYSDIISSIKIFHLLIKERR